MKEDLTDILSKHKGFKEWVKKNYGYTLGSGLWKHTLQYDLVIAIVQKWLREEHYIYAYVNWADFQLIIYDMETDKIVFVKDIDLASVEDTVKETEEVIYEALKLI